MKKITIASLVVIGMFCASVRASVLSVPVKVIDKGDENVAVKLGIHAAENSVACGVTELAAIAVEHESARSATRGAVQAIAKETGNGIGEMGKDDRDNPEVAVAVADLISKNAPVAFAKSLFVAGMAALAGFVLWFLLSWLRLVRNLGALAARKMAVAMHGGDVMTMSVNDAGTKNRSGFSRLEVLFAVAACLALTILGVWRMVASGSNGADPVFGNPSAPAERAETDKAETQAKQDERIAKRKAVIAKLHAAYADTIEHHYRNFLADIDNVSDVQFGIVRMGIPAVVEKFGTFSRCKELFTTIVTDKLKGKNETGCCIKRDLEVDYYKGLSAARDRVYGCLENFLRNAECAKETFRLELAAELDTAELPGDGAYNALLEECGERIKQKKEELKSGQNDAGIALAFEAVCIRHTVATVAKIFGKTVARQAGTMAAGAGAAVSDGPLPVGDAIAAVAIVGCTAWSAWDVWKATKVLPAELRATLEATTRQCERQTLDDVKSAGEKVYLVYCTEKST